MTVASQYLATTQMVLLRDITVLLTSWQEWWMSKAPSVSTSDARFAHIIMCPGQRSRKLACVNVTGYRHGEYQQQALQPSFGVLGTLGWLFCARNKQAEMVRMYSPC